MPVEQSVPLFTPGLNTLVIWENIILESLDK